MVDTRKYLEVDVEEHWVIKERGAWCMEIVGLNYKGGLATTIEELREDPEADIFYIETIRDGMAITLEEAEDILKKLPFLVDMVKREDESRKG